MSFPPPGDLPDPGIEPESPGSPALAGRLFTTVPPGKPHYSTSTLNNTPRGAMTVPRPTIKVKKQAVAQFLEIPTPSPKL